MLLNGNVVAGESYPQGSSDGHLEAEVVAESDGWIAARLSSEARDSFLEPIYAHTSPVYVKCGVDGPEKKAAAAGFDEAIERSMDWVRTKGKFYTDSQRREVVDLFRQGQQAYRDMLR